MTIYLDNGHGKETPGKRSPDSQLMEWSWNRTFVDMLLSLLRKQGTPVRLVCPEDTDIPLRQRCQRVNQWYKEDGDALLISIHVNAAGSDGNWHQANGWQVCVSTNASDRSKEFATYIANEIRADGLNLRVPNRNQPYWIQNLAICRDSKCPAVLCENLFMDCLTDCQMLLRSDFLWRMADSYISAINKYIKKYG